jgi:O-antigen/teichoic acid export membrane protein
LVISFAFCYKYFSITFDHVWIKALLNFGYVFLFYGLFLISLDLIDRYILQFYKGDEDVGIYSACYRIGMAMNLVISGFRTAWIPFFLKLRDVENNKEIFSKVFSYFTYGGMLFFLIISLFASDIIKIQVGSFTFLDKKYWGGISIVPFILFAYFFFGLFTNLNIAAFYENKIKYIILSTFAGCISNIIFNIILIPKFSMMGAATATLLSYSLMFSILYFFSQKLYYIKYEWNKILSVIFLSIILLIINLIWPDILFGIHYKIYLQYFLKIISVVILVSVILKLNTLKLVKK